MFSSSQVMRTTALLNTTVVSVVCGHSQTTSRAVLDTGATMSLITSRLANLLKAKGNPRRSPFRALEVICRVTTLFCLNLHNAHWTFTKSLHVHAHVVESIIPDVPAQNLHSLISQSFLRDKELAVDPYVSSSRRIDILLDVAHTNLTLVLPRLQIQV